MDNRAAQRLDPQREQHREHEHDRRVSEREEEADTQRPLAIGHQLAGCVVDRGDVIGVKRVPEPERVSGQSRANRQPTGSSQAVVMRRDKREKQEEAERV
jgi:hypothetical protein